MKILKGCLSVFLIFVLIISTIISIFFYKKSKAHQLQYDKVNIVLMQYENKMKERNAIVFRNYSEKDSIFILAKKSDSILKIKKSLKELLWNEFYLSSKTYGNKNFEKIDEELKYLNIDYNGLLNDYQLAFTIFPANLVKNETHKRFDFFDVSYAGNNVEKMKKRKEVEHWVETGEWKAGKK